MKLFMILVLLVGACGKSPTEPKDKNPCAPRECVVIIERPDSVDTLVVKTP